MNPSRIRGAVTSAVLVFFIAFFCLGGGTVRAIIDLNGNGMSDIWELIYGGGLNPNADLDGTGMTNLQKSIAGLNPWNSSSVFSASVIAGAGSNLVLSWPSVVGKQYQIQGAASLTSGSWTAIGGALAGTGAMMSGTVTRGGTANLFNVSVTDVYDSGEASLSNWEALELGLDPTNIYSNGHVDSHGNPLTNYSYVVAALSSTNVVTVTATKPTATIPQTNPATDPGTFTVTRSGNLNAITVYLEASGSAVAGTDYASLPVSCSFPVGVNSVTIPVVPLAGSSAAPATPVVLSVVPNAAYQVGGSGSGTVLLFPHNIAPMTWTTGTAATPVRSDWINVKTDPEMTIHAVGNGLADDTAALQQALNLSSTSYATRTTVYLPPGTYRISSTLYWNSIFSSIQEWTGWSGLRLVGCGSSTVIQWAGAAGQVMFLDQGSNRSHFEGIVWEAGASGSAAGIGVAHVPLVAQQTLMRHENEAFIGFVGASGSATISPPYTYTVTTGTISTSANLPVGVTTLPLTTIPGGLIVGVGVTAHYGGIATGSNGLTTTTTVTAINTGSNTVTISAPTNYSMYNGEVVTFTWSVPGTPETVPASGIFAGSKLEILATAETMIWNCIFQNDTVGVVVAYEEYNNYMWIFKSCEFDNCGTGIVPGDGKEIIMDTHFSGSTTADVTGGNATRVRRCTSSGSKQFFAGGDTGATEQNVIEDCWVDGWTSTNGAIAFNDRSDMVFDCMFTHPPVGSTGAIYMWPSNVLDLTLSNNYTSSPTMPMTYIRGGTVNIVNIPPGALPPNLTSPNQTFIQPTWPADGQTILNITQPPYNAVRGTDCTTVIQNAINQAKSNNNGTIVYIPAGQFNTSATLNVSGGNYVIQGCGVLSILNWSGTATTTVPMFTVTTPQNIAIEQIQATIGAVSGSSNQPVISETSTGPSSATYDEVISGAYTNSPGVVLTSLPTGSTVFMPMCASALTVNDCGPAVIFSNYFGGNGLSVTGATQAKSGFLGFLTMECGNEVQGNTSGWDVIINDNQDFIGCDYYNEQTYNHLLAKNTDGATWAGRISMQGMKEESDAPSITIGIQNYGGRIFYTCQSFFDNDSQPVFTQTGSAAVDLDLIGEVYYSNPSFTLGSACNLIEVNDIYSYPSVTYMANVEPAGWGASLAAGLDHFRQADAYDLTLSYGWAQGLNNPTFETDPTNSAPLTTLGTAPAQWTVSGTIAAGSGVRDVCAVTGGSPFASGTQSAAFVDTTGTATGSPLQWSQSLATAWSASQGCVFTYDCHMNPAGPGITSNLWVQLFANAGGETPCSIGLDGTGNNSTWALVAYQGGTLKTLATLAVGTWYRMQAVVPPPGTGGSVTLYVTPWTSAGAGTTANYTLDGEAGASTTGFNKVSFGLTGAGQETDCNFDNISINSNPLYTVP